ncbi:MAG: metallophosphoesterase family protein [Spirochaetales bacterium]|jgi:predicted phosphodiesterase|nr:metallophosphoesterase family protein [Spirochaetales bacterium]
MKPIAILSADIHRQEQIPVCRTDDFFSEQERKLMWLDDLQQKYGCPVLDSGDLFSHWKPSPWLITSTLMYLPDEFYTVPGNHDLPGHNINLLNKSGLAVLEAAGRVTIALEPIVKGNFVIHPFPYGSELKPLTKKSNGVLDVAICHAMVYQGKEPWPGCTDPDSSRFLRKMKGYDLVLTGHNHKPFTEDLSGRLLVNPGSLMRRTADQWDHRPRVYLWYPDNTIEAVFVPIAEGVISREHLEKKVAKDERMASYVQKLSETEYELSSKFEENLEKIYQQNKIRQSVKDLINTAMGEG